MDPIETLRGFPPKRAASVILIKVGIPRLPRLARSMRGQASLLVAFMMLTFLLFFSFVIHTGMLVNAKINLQNAADLAAYAGASAQARQMNAIAHLNYEMRRQYKRFLFRYYVLGQRGYYGNGTANPAFTKWKRAADDPTAGLSVPTICVHFFGNENYCKAKDLQPLQAGIVFNPNDPIAAALQQQIQALEQLRLKSGDLVDSIQAIATMLWLYNTDPDLTQLVTAMESSGNTAAQTQIKNLTTVAKGLGLVPRMHLLKARAATLETILKEKGKLGLTRASVDRLAQDEFAAAQERSVLAFRSAYRTLGERSFDEESIRLDELLPSSVFKLETQTESFDVYYLKLLKKNTTAPPSQPHYTLTAFPERITVFGMPVGVYKDKTSLTYYAVRLQAKAKLFFAKPFGSEIDLTAYAAARPFGSRLGPWKEAQFGFFTTPFTPPTPPTGPNYFEGAVGSLVPFVREPCINFGGGGGPITVQTCAGRVPNLPIQASELSSGPEKGFLSLNSSMRPLGNFFNDVSGASVSEASVQKAERVAMGPNPFELGLYSIPYDSSPDESAPNRDAFIENFSPQGILSIYAPLYPPGLENASELYAAIMADLQKSKMEMQTAQTVAQGITTYVSGLRNHPGEDGETYQIAKIRDPWQQDPSPPLPTIQIQAPTATLVKTAWSDSWNKNLKDQGPREGYSVKFVTFETLLNSRTLVDGEALFPTNTSQLTGLIGEDATGLRDPASH